ncbi:MAG: thiamine pyrophosphate-binding protein [Hyphomonadaceae bacterium]|nr:thiamine pyrophosphate-binding protein [Hyphomonadaceae bacterium]
MAGSAAALLVESLIAQGASRVFCVPGESYLPVLDALHAARDRIETIVCRHEAGAANMAEATGKLNGRPGICFVTRGPGATHASIGVHTARQDSTPMLLFIGQVARGDIGREAFQEIDYGAFFGPITKWAASVDDPTRIPELVSRATATALAGRRGPVALALPEDILEEPVEAAPAPRVFGARAALDPASLAAIAARLAAARAPLLLLGGSGWDEAGLAAIERFARRADLPVVLSFRRKDLLDNTHAHYAGDLGLGPNPKLVARVKQADLVLCVGARLGENPTQGYTLFTRDETAAKLIHIHPGAEELGRVWPPAIAAVADPNLAADALAHLDIAPHWADWRAAAHAEAIAWRAPIAVSGAVNLSEVFAHLRAALPDDAIVANGAGNYAAWLHRFFPHARFGTQLAPTSGAMGYGFPAGIAAKIAHRDRDVVAVAGDGCFLMSAQEMATAMRHEAALVTLVIDNASYGTIRMHQERRFPARVHATDLVNPDFAAFARSFGAWGETVTRTEDFPDALAQARAAGRPALLHIKTDVENISPGRTIADLRGA